MLNNSVQGKTLPRVSPDQVGLCPQRSARLVAVLQAEVDRQRLPGAVVLVARHGKLALFESLGALDPAVQSPMTPDAIFRIYSMTKPIVSVAAMMLMEQGQLLLNDPVAKYLPEYAMQKVASLVDGTVQLQAVRQAVTLQDLMRHTAGLTYEFMGNASVQRQYAQLRIGSRTRSNAEFSHQLAALPLMFEPGTVWEYGRATDVLGRVLEVVSGQTLGAYLHQHIFKPLGMTDTGFFVPPEQHARIAEPFASDPEGGVQMRLIDVREQAALESGGGGLASTALDFARFLQFMLNKGELGGVRLLGPRTVDFMTADHLGDIAVNRGASRALLPPGHGFGLGVAVRKEVGIASVPGSVGSYFWGGMAGTTFFVDPAEDLFAILMLQAPNQREYYRMLFRDLVYATLID
ncbi:MAG: beta-lactamase family protein [Gammaproteobacteria bacterium]|uniref:serine hydrolase domain-containing protein n=1 Tax=Rhodoferax sp. TaxID=50421 RepID=UPI0017F3597E|nr:serine hydrolase domain-containing protein [Rhodoferax sp.]MBU3899510.1 beta-lactamase family protein [Gammaproteobacteria bacterium]MBA3059580.1 beta-lactamase family protein [Rhodoferax sp.]MBU3998677.1 beta-lactamase family protein [Gammaproteobacteria bacterium]MBU4017986.1 beta-lactamase family protein [Gammaproteobacteria bacterium]MBU4080323.1 beta-lactamase family protein [Gammaproteobacteria bacterium]